MPERPKRRKNKNKRKNNKNNKPDVNQNQSEANEFVNTDVCGQNADLNAEEDSQIVVENETSTVSCSEKQNVAGSSRDDSENINQDLNNNRDGIVDTSSQSSTITCKSESINDPSHEQTYVVETPENTIKRKTKASKLKDNIKSKSLDNDDAPKIVEITEEDTEDSIETNNLPLVNSNNVIISDVESDIEWENTDEFQENVVPTLKDLATGTLSIATIPLNVAQCDQTKSLTPECEKSLRDYLQTLNLSSNPSDVEAIEIRTEIEHIINREIRHRLRKKGLADDFLYQRPGPPRILDVIDEEGSSESSLTSRRHSRMSEKKSDAEDLDDDVFEDKKSKNKYSTKLVNTQSEHSQRAITQPCVLVDTKFVQPNISEARGNWTLKTMEKMTGAELVYLTDSSSSTSSIHDCGEETDDGVDTDVSIRMITPTIEVIDTENLLKNNFISSNEQNSKINETTNDLKQKENTNNNVTEIKKEVYIENDNEIVVLSTDNIKTNLYVKDIDETVKSTDDTCLSNDVNMTMANNDKNETVLQNPRHDYEVEMKVLKCELNDAINNLVKEIVSESDTNNDNRKENFNRQDSSSSVGSSQCTAKYNPNYSSLNDVSNMHDETEIHNKNTDSTHTTEVVSHVKDVFECVTGAPAHSKKLINIRQPLALRDLCVRKISTLPYGERILEELAAVSQRLQNITILGSFSKDVLNKKSPENKITTDTAKSEGMPYYPLPDVSCIKALSLETKRSNPIPPPIQPRNSSLKKSQEEPWTGLPTKSEPVYVCLSPSQKMLMEKTNTVITKEDASQLVDMHRKFVDRRGYNEYYTKGKSGDVVRTDGAPVVPFKSQTGSRLLALIRDPTITNELNSSNVKRYNRSSDHIDKSYTHIERMSKRIHDQFSSIKDYSSFKPIPPPRPRKYSSYESDESSDFTDASLRSLKSERKFFHYSTGNLNKEIESDVSTIQNLHRYYTNVRDQTSLNSPRRPSLPKDLCEQQMEYIRQKEKEVEAELKRLEGQKLKITSEKRGPKAPLISEKEIIEENITDKDNYLISRKKDYITQIPEKGDRGKLSSVFNSSQEEILRDKMYSEYVSQMAERQERKQQKVIKITNYPSTTGSTISKSMPALDILDSKVNNRIEKEFISKARERWDKLGIKDPETEDERESGKEVYKEPRVIEHKIKVIEGNKETDVQRLPNHLQDFVSFTAKDKEQGSGGSETVMIAPTFKARSTSPAVWRPGAPTPPPAPGVAQSPSAHPQPPPPPPPPVWTPSSAGTSPQTPRKTFHPVHFEETPPTRRKFPSAEQNGCTSGSESEGRLRTSHSAPASGLNSLGGPTVTSRLPRAQNPTVTLLQKAREGQIPRGPNYPFQERDAARLPRDRPSPPRGDPVHALRKEYAEEKEADKSDYERGGPNKMADAHRKVEGIGPTTKEGMPVALRSEVKDPSKWYKKMYDTIHKNKYDDDYVTIRYKSRRGQPPQRVTNKSQYAYFDPRSGYLSEPEGGLSRLGYSTWSDAYDSDVTSGPRRRTASVQEERRINEESSPYLPNNKYSTLASARASQEVYKNQPGRIENYVPGKSSVIDKEAKQWWDEVMDIFDGHNVSSTTSLPQASPKEKKDITSAILSKSNMARALKESGYESDSTLVFRRRDETEAPLSPAERRAAYRDLQAGGEPPLRGFRSPAPPRQESPRRYVESDVNIHYRCPVRHDPLPLVPERELARQQAEHMKRLYREQKRNKYLQELQDMQNRRHQDNFTPSQKNILPLNRYDEAERVAARALYAFNGQTSRELSFRKGDLIHVRRQIDANWYEGELHGKIGLFPYNYVEILKGDVAQTAKKPAVIEGRARAKFDFIAQTNLELPLKKGELVILSRRIDQNWWEGRNGSKTGIFPDSYITVLQEPSQNKPEPQPILSTEKPVASPAAHGLLNGTAKRSMGTHSYTPQHNNPALANAPPATQPLPGYVAKPAQATLTPAERGYGPPTTPGVDLNNTEPLYVDTNAEAVPYRAMYKYRPQNPDELELNEGDTVYVLEQCDDGWYVGSSQRTGRFGTFPGNYVERI